MGGERNNETARTEKWYNNILLSMIYTDGIIFF